MKKILGLLLIAGMMSFTACGGKKDAAAEGTETPTEATTPTEAPPADAGATAPADTANKAGDAHAAPGGDGHGGEKKAH